MIFRTPATRPALYPPLPTYSNPDRFQFNAPKISQYYIEYNAQESPLQSIFCRRGSAGCISTLPRSAPSLGAATFAVRSAVDKSCQPRGSGIAALGDGRTTRAVSEYARSSMSALFFTGGRIGLGGRLGSLTVQNPRGPDRGIRGRSGNATLRAR